MPLEIRLPRLGESVDEGVVTAWLVDVGDHVEVDQPIAELSTDKVDTEIPSPGAGTVVDLRVAVDEVVQVGAVLALLDGADRDDPAAPPPAPSDTGAPPTVAPSASPADDPPGRLSPKVRRLLREAGLQPGEVDGSGPGGRITPRDVERATTRPAPSARVPAPTPATASPGPSRDDEVVELSRVRRTIARVMHSSLQATAQLTAAVEVDMTRVMVARERARDAVRAREGVPLSPLALVARAVCTCLQRHPVLNASIDVEAGTATFHRDVDLGIAVDTPHGLVVPTISSAQDLTVPALARRITDLAARARARELSPDEVTGGTFTITNTGSRGAIFDTPILNPPEVGILATTLIEKRPVVVTDALGQDSIAIRHMSYFCLTYDHRMLDGADAARFLTDLRFELEQRDQLPEY